MNDLIEQLELLNAVAAGNNYTPRSVVAGLRRALEMVRDEVTRPPQVVTGNPAGTPGAKVDASRLDLPAQEVPTHRTCLQAHDGYVVGEVLPEGQFDRPEHWAPCDAAGWVFDFVAVPPGVTVERHRNLWRPTDVPRSQAVSALDEMAEQVARWAAPAREAGPVAWFDDAGEIRGRVSDEQLDAMCRTAMAALDKRNGWTEQVALRNEADRFESEMFKPTNPKDAAATGRVPLGLLSPIAKAHWALAQHCGRAKYGAWNWREAGARTSIYLDAIDRHKDGYLSGETHDPADGTHHLGNIMACCAILLEAEGAGKLVDDRPPTLDMRPTYADVEKRMADLTAKYADRNPKHWTR